VPGEPSTRGNPALRQEAGFDRPFQGHSNPPPADTTAVQPGEVQSDWAGNPVVTSTVAARTVTAYERARVATAKAKERAAALEREKREVHFAGGYSIPEDTRGPAMHGLTYSEMRAEEARRGNYPPPVFDSKPGDPIVDTPEEARAVRQGKLDKMNEDTKAKSRAAAPPPRR